MGVISIDQLTPPIDAATPRSQEDVGDGIEDGDIVPFDGEQSANPQ